MLPCLMLHNSYAKLTTHFYNHGKEKNDLEWEETNVWVTGRMDVCLTRRFNILKRYKYMAFYVE